MGERALGPQGADAVCRVGEGEWRGEGGVYADCWGVIDGGLSLIMGEGVDDFWDCDFLFILGWDHLGYTALFYDIFQPLHLLRFWSLRQDR